MNKIFELKFGSNLYGTNTPSSDTDLKAIYLPEARDIVLGRYKKTISTTRPKQTGERNNKDDIDIEIFSLDRYLKLLSEGQTVSLDILFANQPDFTYFNPDYFYIFQEIYNNKDKLICKDIAAFFGYAKQQAAKYGLKGFRVAAFREALEFVSQYDDHMKLSHINIRFPMARFVYKDPEHSEELNNEYIKIVRKVNPKGLSEEFLEVAGKFYAMNCTVKLVKSQLQEKFDEYGKRALLAEKNEGIDWKALSHAVRVNSQGVELLNTGRITFPRPDRELLLQIKTGQLQYKQVEEIILEGFDNLERAKEQSTLRAKPDQEWIDGFVEHIYTDIVKGTL